MFGVVTDTTHTAGFQLHCQILCHIFKSLENGTVAVPLYPGEPNEANPDWLQKAKAEIQHKNIEFVQNYIAELLKKIFIHVQSYLEKYIFFYWIISIDI